MCGIRGKEVSSIISQFPAWVDTDIVTEMGNARRTGP